MTPSNGNGYLKQFALYGVAPVIVITLLWALVPEIPAIAKYLLSIDRKIDTVQAQHMDMMQKIDEAYEDIEQRDADLKFFMQQSTKLQRGICLNTAKTDTERIRCNE